MKLYEIAAQYRNALAVLDDADLPAEVIKDTLEGLEGDLQVKATSVAAYFENLNAEVAAMKQAEQRIAARRKSLEARIENGRDYLKSSMESCGITEIKSPELLIRIKKNPPSVVIEDEQKLPVEFLRTKTEVVVDKAAIKKQISAGETVPGAHLEQKTRIEIA